MDGCRILLVQPPGTRENSIKAFFKKENRPIKNYPCLPKKGMKVAIVLHCMVKFVGGVVARIEKICCHLNKSGIWLHNAKDTNCVAFYKYGALWKADPIGVLSWTVAHLLFLVCGPIDIIYCIVFSQSPNMCYSLVTKFHSNK